MNRLLTLLAQVDIKPGDIDVPKGPLGSGNISSILQIVFGVFGGTALIIITLAGFKYVLSQGNPQETAKAKNTILYALIGLVIAISALGIVTFAVDNL